jgi:hypothetical protein
MDAKLEIEVVVDVEGPADMMGWMVERKGIVGDGWTIPRGNE